MQRIVIATVALCALGLFAAPSAAAGPTCFEYTPGSLSNVCVNAGVHPGSTPVEVASVCIVGPVCTPSETVNVPTGDPYYEVEYLEVDGCSVVPLDVGSCPDHLPGESSCYLQADRLRDALNRVPEGETVSREMASACYLVYGY